MIRLEDFLPGYPDTADPLFQQKIYNKEEFYQYRLARDQEEIAPSGYLNQQIIGARFMAHTEYDGLLVFHQQGVGKTCFAHAVAESLRATGNYKRCIVLARGRDLLVSIMRAFVYSCLKNTELAQKRFRDVRAEMAAIRKVLRGFYSFNTFLIFARELAAMSDEQIAARFSDTVFIVDEVHNIAAPFHQKVAEGTSVYKQIHRLFHLTKNCKKLLMSATPMSDDVAEIATVMNLLLEDPLPTGRAFEQAFLKKEPDDTFTVRADAVPILKRAFAGRISYLLARNEDINIIY